MNLGISEQLPRPNGRAAQCQRKGFDTLHHVLHHFVVGALSPIFNLHRGPAAPAGERITHYGPFLRFGASKE